MGNNNNDNNNTIKIISWNVNAFCKTDNWNDLKKKKELKEYQDKYSENIISGIKLLLKKIEDDGVLFLQEVPKSSNSLIIKKITSSLKDLGKYEIKNNIPKGQRADICTIAIYKNNDKNKWTKIPYKTTNNNYSCRSVLISNGKISILGIPAKTYYTRNYDENEYYLSLLDVICNAQENKYDIIIGDFNIDNENNPRYTFMKVLKNVGYEEADGDAERKEVGEPKTHYYKIENGEEEGSHVDYALIREDSKSKFTVEKYSILTDYKEYSDHYPIMLEINLNNDKEEA